MTDPQPPSSPSGSYPNGGGSFGRDFRLVLGGLAILGDFVLLYMEHVHAVPPATYSAPDVVMHIVIFVLGVFLMDARRTIELLGSIKDRIPLIGGK